MRDLRWWSVWFLSVALWMMLGRSMAPVADGGWIMANLLAGAWLAAGPRGALRR